MPHDSWVMLRRRAPRVAMACAACLVALGIGLRVLAFMRRDALWGDEAALGLNILACDFSKLGRPFLHAQVAPYLFMAAEKLMSLMLGAGERSLRAWSLVAGSALLPALYVVTRRIADRASALTALAIAAATPLLVYYATELKPYAGDALVSTWLIGCGGAALGPARRRGLVLLTAAGVVAPWLSLPSVFVLTGCGAAVCAQLLSDRARPREWAFTAAMGCSWLLSFGLHYACFLHQTPTDAAYMQEYWAAADGFPGGPHSVAVVSRWCAAKLFYLFAALVSAVGYGQRYLTAGLWLLGLWQLWRTQRASVALFIVPVLALFAAAVLHAYAIADRLALFLCPVLLIPCALGLTRLVRKHTRLAPLLLAASALVALEHVQIAVAQLPPARAHGDIRALVGYLQAHVAPGDSVLVETRVAWVYDYYAYRRGLRGRTAVIDAERAAPSELRQHLPKAGTARVWAVVPALGPSSSTPLDPATQRTLARIERHVVDALSQLGQQLEVYDASNVRLYLYDLSTRTRAP